MNLETQETMPMDETQSQDTDRLQADTQKNDIDKLLDSTNIAESLSEEELTTIGAKCLQGFSLDLTSRSDWEQNLDTWLKLAMQTREEKNFPWPKASNIKYPLLSTAAMQFQARAYPTLVPSDGKVVKAKILGKDQEGTKSDKADAISTYMSYQIMYEMDGWEEHMDKLLMMLPIIGTVFKKTYYDKSKDSIVSVLVSPKQLVVNYWTKTLADAERISEVIELSPRLVKERQLQGIFLDVSLGAAPIPSDHENTPSHDSTTPYTFVEQHTFLDLDNDGYEEPYIVTFHRETGKVVRILARFFKEDIQHNGKKITQIKPREFYTKYSFIPNPDGSFYDLGFGVLLGPINESVNTLVNQLTDAGSLSNMQSGFIGKGLRIKMGDMKFGLGEWKPVNASAEDLRKQIVPLPAKDPSNVLFQLMTALITSGKELASVAEIFVGKMPGQNTPATTTMASIEQGMKVFTAVYKRVYRSLELEFKKIFRLNKLYLDPNTYSAIVQQTLNPEDFDEELYDVCPAADPTAISQTEKLIKAQGLMELVQGFGQMMNPVEVLERILIAQEQPNWQKLLNPQVAQTRQAPEPPPDPKLLAIQSKAQAEQQKIQMLAQQQQQEQYLEQQNQQTQLAMAEQEHQVKMNTMMQEAQAKLAIKAAETRINIQQAKQEHTQKAVQSHQTHLQQMQLSKEKASLQKKNSTSGKPTPSQKASSKK